MSRTIRCGGDRLASLASRVRSLPRPPTGKATEVPKRRQMMSLEGDNGREAGEALKPRRRTTAVKPAKGGHGRQAAEPARL